MERHLVIGTAGHIDHGKTTLVKALTGVDTDRLAEEKARGITIDIGFAPLTIGETRFSIVDVPGHEAFIRNMLAGATGIDLALLVVAADEGVMPQTKEHVAILRFLGVRRGVVALTKCDAAADADWRALVAEDVTALLRASVGETWPVVEVSATAGTGLEALRAALAAAAHGCAERTDDDLFRMPVDRVFALAGAGTIVTGTVWSGRVVEADTVAILPAARTARVRSVQVHGASATKAEPARRTALALVGVDRSEVERGSVVLGAGAWRAARAIDVLATMLADAGVALEPRTRLRVHHGTAEVMARVGRTEHREGEGGAGIAARLLLEQPLVTRAGDAVVLRSYSPVTTVGGAIVLDPWADAATGSRIGREGRRALCASWTSDTERVVRLIERRGARGMTVEDLAVAAGLPRARLRDACAAVEQAGIVRIGDVLIAGREIAPIAARLDAALEAFHGSHPLEPGMPLEAWRAAGDAPSAATALAESRLAADGSVTKDGSIVRRRGFTSGGGARAQDRDRVLEALRSAGGEPPSVVELATAHPGVDVAGILRFLAREGLVVAVARDRFYEAGALTAARHRLIAAVAELGSGATASALRERLGVSRKYLIPFLEWADREGVTSRRGDTRVLGPNGVLDGQPKPA